MRVVGTNGKVYDIKFYKQPRVLKKSRFKGRLVIDTACVVSVGSASVKEGFTPVTNAIAVHSPKEPYNKYMGKKVSLRRALSMSNLEQEDVRVILSQFEKEFAHCRK